MVNYTAISDGKIVAMDYNLDRIKKVAQKMALTKKVHVSINKSSNAIKTASCNKSHIGWFVWFCRVNILCCS